MKQLILTGIWMGATLALRGQVPNLVPDPGFERTKEVPYSEAQLYLLHTWFSPNPLPPVFPNATPDLLHVEGSSYASLPYSRFGTTYPAEGQACGGFVARSGSLPDFREYLCTPLTESLKPGTTYEVRFSLTTGGPTPDSLYGVYGCSHIGCWLSETRPRQLEHEPLTFASPQWEAKQPVTGSAWQVIRFTFIAEKPLNYLTIGCFRPDKQVRQQHYRTGLPPMDAGFSYYFVDQVSVTPVPEKQPEPLVHQEDTPGLPVRDPVPVPGPEAPKVASRKKDHQGRFRVEGDSLRLSLFDAGAEDKDTISVFFNGAWVLRATMVKTRPQSLTVPLLKGRNELLVYAHNTGNIPPNTAVLEWESGGKTHRVEVVSDLKRCAAVMFER